jgi:hypothetical protein
MLFSFFIYPLYSNKVVYIFGYFLFCLWLFYEDKKECNRLLIWLLLLSCTYSFKLVSDDIFNDYSYSKKVSNYFLNDKRDNIKVLTFETISDVIMLLDDRYVFIDFLCDKEYTFYESYNDISNYSSNLEEYIIDNDIDYLVVDKYKEYKLDEINNMLDKNMLSKELETYSLDRVDLIVYKVN